MPKRFTLGCSCSAEMGRALVGCVCSWKQTSLERFCDYAHVTQRLSDFSNRCCSPAWPVAIN